jgi:hypothetical protein
MSIQRSASPALLATIVTVTAGFLYLLTAARDIVVGDSPDLITAAVVLGVPHPPGYPLFTLLGHVFSLLPLGAIPFRVNLVSVVCDAITAGLVFLTAFRLSRSPIAAAAAAFVLALDPPFWSWSLVAEVFPLNNLLAALLIYLLVIWNDDPKRYGFLALAAFIAGLALTNHQTIVLLGPSVCFILWRHRAILLTQPRIIAICAAAFLVGLLPYAYIPWATARHPVYDRGGISSLDDFIAFVTRRRFGSHHLVPEVYQGGAVWPRLVTLCYSFGGVMGLFVILGAIRAVRYCRWYFWFSLLAFASTGLLFAMISNFNLPSMVGGAWVLERFFLLPLVAVAPLVALGVVMLAERLASVASELRRQSVPIISGGLAVVLAVGLVTNYRRIDQSNNHIARNYGEDLLASVGPDSILFAAGDPCVLPLMYLTAVEKQRPDVTVIAIPFLPARWYIAQLRMHNPHLNIPFDAYDMERNNFKAIIEANRERPIALAGPVPDGSAMRDYWPYPHGLVQLIEPNSKWIDVGECAKDNLELMKRYRTPTLASINASTFERAILFFYSFGAWQVGTNYELSGSKSEAQAWYRRAREIDPESETLYRQLQQGAARAQGLYNGVF